MSAWSAERKLLYAILFFALLFIVIFIPVFFVWYEAPSCTDGTQNQKETGIDCGGPCRNICQRAQEAPVVIWKRTFELSPNTYHASAYVENPNIGAYAMNVPYRFVLYNDQGTVIAERKGSTSIPPNKRFIVFQPLIKTTEPVKRVDFEFTDKAFWQRSLSPDPVLSVVSKQLFNAERTPRIEALVRNDSIVNVGQVDVAAILYDGSGNAQLVSQTIIESLKSGETKTAVFTWPNPLARTVQCSRPSDVVLVIDRSGSMDDDGTNPPQPLTAVKDAAQSFVARATLNDRIGVVSFATQANQLADAKLSADLAGSQQAIANIQINPQDIQHTNIADGLLGALAEFDSGRARESSVKAIVMLTDGVATRPLKTGDADYPETAALEAAAQIKTKGINLYTIGLGSQVNQSFLADLASTPDNYYFASTTRTLSDIYTAISSAICQERPTVIEIIPLIHR